MAMKIEPRYIRKVLPIPKGDGILKNVFICSPYRGEGETEEELEKSIRDNIYLAQDACRYAVFQGCVPYAPHLYFTQMLDDDDSQEHVVGMDMGLLWLADCDELWVIGHRISEGMEKEIKTAGDWGIPVRYFCRTRSLEERLLDAVLFPERDYQEFDTSEVGFEDEEGN